MDHPADAPAAPSAADFIREIITEDLRTGKHNGRVHTRFPPEPNGYLHVGHAKSICLNFGVAAEFAGLCNLRYDDTNPTKEDVEYVESIEEDVRWLGFDWGDRKFYASDYFERLYQYAEQLVRDGKAYVDDLSADQIRTYRGTLTEPGRNSPYRDRPVEESLDLFRRMRAGEFPDGTYVLRAKIDMASPNINMRDPTLYRIRHAAHHRTGDAWCIYPTYDYAHPISDALEGITHSLCTLEFEDHRPLYDWVIEHTHPPYRPRQIEFARLNLNYTVMSKRKLLQLVEQRLVSGWDDPRMPTLAGIRRRGFTPEAVRDFCTRIGMAKKENVVDVALLEHTVREDLNRRALRALAVLRPLKVVIENYPEGREEHVEATNNPEDAAAGTRRLPFSRELVIERDDFMEQPPKKFFRLAPGAEVRLRYGYILKCERVIKDGSGAITELRCTYDPESLSGQTAARRVKGTIHWVSARHARDAEVRLYDRLFQSPDPGEGDRDPITDINPRSLERLTGCKIEPGLADAPAGTRFQFERLGYFCVDPDSRPGAPVFNRTVTLKDTWAKIAGRQGEKVEK
ncbi:MAG: glutamine--tRNA ligase [Acidobacteria bacterium RIFCSPLOWO2_02_FULL_68_18]|nr:MAG: glutamine--tRNA ligase [Acidobacteria bacterium RIFCSPLOWO2_02_FULL_68_18]OFW49594.1 MAG: glutamine--tRNA ligase [Acidobacteria bacterium RIFCSPLOWO2_12_FULL_68_19]